MEDAGRIETYLIDTVLEAVFCLALGRKQQRLGESGEYMLRRGGSGSRLEGTSLQVVFAEAVGFETGTCGAQIPPVWRGWCLLLGTQSTPP